MPLSEIPFAATIVDRSTLSSVPRGVAADEPLKFTPGVKVDNQANGSRVHLSIRGQGILMERGIRGIRVLYDECPLNDPSGFAPDFFDIDMSGIKRIDILRGPAASLYGASASGGVVSFTSRPLHEAPHLSDAERAGPLRTGPLHLPRRLSQRLLDHPPLTPSAPSGRLPRLKGEKKA